MEKEQSKELTLTPSLPFAFAGMAGSHERGRITRVRLTPWIQGAVRQ